MGVRINFDGMNELRSALQALPQELANEAAGIVGTYAKQAEVETENGYPIGPTGNLRRRVTLSVQSNNASVKAIVSSRAPHAWIFEHGTGNRVTRNGANRGRMPQARPEQRMIPKVQRIRARMVNALIAFVREKGFVVNE